MTPPEPSNYQLMLAGEPYMSPDPEIGRHIRRARQLTATFNAASHDDYDGRHAILAELFGAFGSGSGVTPPFRCDYGLHIFIGDNVYMNYDCVLLDSNEIRIGSRSLFGPKVQLYTATHPIDPTLRGQGWQTAHPITIGEDVWIGGGTIVCPGVTIGSGTTIGAGSVVTRDVPSGVFAAGNPCRVIRELAPNDRGDGASVLL